MKRPPPSGKHQATERDFRGLLEIMARLRSPEGGCPWDLRQDEKSIGGYLLEEAYEVLDAIDSGSPDALKEELGDLLFQIVFLTQLAAERGLFDMGDVVEEIARKMTRRHPHVFGNARVGDAQEVKDRWEEIKKNVERKKTDPLPGARIPRSLPALARAQRVIGEVSLAGLERWEKGSLLTRADRTLAGLRKALAVGHAGKTAEKLGELLLTIANVGRLSGVDAEEALRTAMRRFTDRLRSKGKSRTARRPRIRPGEARPGGGKRV